MDIENKYKRMMTFTGRNKNEKIQIMMIKIVNPKRGTSKEIDQLIWKRLAYGKDGTKKGWIEAEVLDKQGDINLNVQKLIGTEVHKEEVKQVEVKIEDQAEEVEKEMTKLEIMRALKEKGIKGWMPTLKKSELKKLLDENPA